MKTRKELVAHYAGLAMQGMAGVPIDMDGVHPHPDNVHEVIKRRIDERVRLAFRHAEAMADEYFKRYPEAPKKKMKTEDELFDKFWALVPSVKKKDKGQAQKYWKVMSQVDKDKAIDQMEAYAQAIVQCQKVNPSQVQFFKAAAPWLNAQGWEDHHTVWQLIIDGK